MASVNKSILTMNAGSATLKASLYQTQGVLGSCGPQRMLSMQLDRASDSKTRITVSDCQKKILFDREYAAASSAATIAVEPIMQWLADSGYASGLGAVGHRIVHGGAQFRQPERITPQMLAELHRLIALDPDHLPAALSGIGFIFQKFPDLPQVACFDTAFHSSLPDVASMYAIPRGHFEAGVRRYGFHGLSYEYIAHALRDLKEPAANGRVVVAHLGSGASIAALREGKSVDTSMGFTPLEGLVMGTRSGDIDPGLLIYLLEQEKMSPRQLDEYLNKQSGLLGVSGTSSDMRELLDKSSAGDARATQAIDIFCYRARKYLGAYAAALGGLDVVVFTAGIGERSAAIRQKICARLEFLGIELDPARNRENAAIISSADSRVTVRVIETNEELMIVRHVLAVLGESSSAS